jgi:hypothetical protein
MADPVTLGELAVILLTAMGGREGIGYVLKKRNGKTNGYVTKEFCGERTHNLKELLDEVRDDVKKILANQRPQ